MNIYRSLIFIPSSSTKMLDKMETLNPDVFLLDLEDSVPKHLKDDARNNINNKIDALSSQALLGSKEIFVRINELGSSFAEKDLESVFRSEVSGFMVPKFEEISKLKELENNLKKKEERAGISRGKIKLILMVESPKGLLELAALAKHSGEEFFKRIFAIALGFEDFARSLNAVGNISGDMCDFVKKSMLVYAKASGFLAIDTVYKDFKDTGGLKADTEKSAAMGFDGRLAIHPCQIEIINSCFMPNETDIKKMELILGNRERIEKEGAINIDGVMYDPPHLKWAINIRQYLDRAENK